MRTAIFADIHGNLEAFEAVLAALAPERVDAFLCAGDIVGYGADPSACIKKVQETGCTCVAGNHDGVAGGKEGLEFFNPWARAALLWTQTHLSPEEKNFLGQLPLVFEKGELALVHGTLHDPQKFYYLDSLPDAAATFRVMSRSLCFVAHNHIPAIIVQNEEGQIQYAVGYSAQRREGCRYIINVGSVGQPRDGRPEAAYCLYDDSTDTIEIRRAEYPVKTAQEKISKAGLPSALANRLAIGF